MSRWSPVLVRSARVATIDGGAPRRIAGTGLGLTIAKALAELQGGSIGVRSTVGEGAAFTVTFPV